MRGEVELYWEVGSHKHFSTKENEKKLKVIIFFLINSIDFFTGSNAKNVRVFRNNIKLF